MIVRNGERYFNIALDSSRSEFVVKSIRERPSSTNKILRYRGTAQSHTGDCITFSESDYYYQPSRYLGGVYYSNTAGKYLYNNAFVTAQFRPNSNTYSPFVIRDSQTDSYISNGEAVIETGTSGGREYVDIKPKSTNATPATTVTNNSASYFEFSDGRPAIDTTSMELNYSSSYTSALYASAWFLCQVQNVMVIPDKAISVDVHGVHGYISQTQTTYRCSLQTSIKYLLGNETEGFLLIYTTGADTVKLLPDDRSTPLGDTSWTQVKTIHAPKLMTYLKYGGNIRICQWGYEYAYGTMAKY